MSNNQQSINPFDNYSGSPPQPAHAPVVAPSSFGWGAALGGAWAPAAAPQHVLADDEDSQQQPMWSQPQPQPLAPQAAGPAGPTGMQQASWVPSTAPPDTSAASTLNLLPAHAPTSSEPAGMGAQPAKSGWFGLQRHPAATPIPTGPPGGAPGEPSVSDTRPLLPETAAPAKPAKDYSKYAFYNLKRYRPYFDVDSREVMRRVLSSFIGAFMANFIETTLEKPDLYGPFWIATTLIFVTAAAGNLASYIQWNNLINSSPPPAAPNSTAAPPSSSSSSPPIQQWYAQPGKLGTSAGIFYGYVFILSILLWLWIKYMRGDIKLVNVFCMYGYALTIYIPVAMLCVIPSQIMQWVLIMFATATGALFLVRNLRTATHEVAIIKIIWLLLVVAACHVGLGLALKLYFFKY